MPIELIPPVSIYVHAVKTADPSILDQCLHQDVRVNDAGENYVMTGLEKVKDWLKSSHEQFNLRIKVTDVTEKDDKTVVTILTSGDFPGSPQPFRYHFTVQDSKIANIDIYPE